MQNLQHFDSISVYTFTTENSENRGTAGGRGG